MGDWMNDPLTARLVVARGWISVSEAVLLKAGDFVRTDTDPGVDSELTLADVRIASGSVILAGDRGKGVEDTVVALRVGGLEDLSEPVKVPYRGDSALEVLPFEIAMAETSYSPSEAARIVVGSFVSLDRPYGDGSGCVMRIFGIPVAEGALAVTGSCDKFSFQVEKILGATSPGTDVPQRLTGAVAPPGGEVKRYRWDMPDHFTRAEITAIDDIHKTFSRVLAGRFGFPEVPSVRLIDQMTYGEFLETGYGKGEKEIAMTMGLRNGDGQGTIRGKTAFLEPVDARHPVFTESERESIAGMVSRESENAASRDIRAYVKSMGELGSRSDVYIAETLKAGWKTAVDIVLERSSSVRTFDEYEMVIAAVISRAADFSGDDIVIVYPKTCLEPFKRELRVYGSRVV